MESEAGRPTGEEIIPETQDLDALAADIASSVPTLGGKNPTPEVRGVDLKVLKGALGFIADHHASPEIRARLHSEGLGTQPTPPEEKD